MEVLGPPLKDMMLKYFPNENPDELIEFYRQINNDELRRTLKPIEHAVEVVSELRKQGYRLAILTTRARPSTIECLKICGFKDDDFEGIITLDDVKNTKPDPEGIFKVIGDSIADVKAGKAYGAYTVAYTVLEGKKEGIEKEKPNRFITDLNEILGIVNEKHYFTYNLK